MKQFKTVRTLRDMKNDPRVCDISDERGCGDGIWVYLPAEWFNDQLGCHTIHEHTVAECCEQLNNTVRPATPEEIAEFNS